MSRDCCAVYAVHKLYEVRAGRMPELYVMAEQRETQETSTTVVKRSETSAHQHFPANYRGYDEVDSG